MHYATAQEGHLAAGFSHDPFKAIAAPRPIGWITALSREGAVNCSPYSFFNAISDRPHMVAFASDGRKDAISFIEETGEFTCSFVNWDTREGMNLTSAPLPRGQSELSFAGLEPAPSLVVKPPRVKAAPAALECKWLQTVPLAPLDGAARYLLVIGQVVAIYVNDAFVKDGMVDTGAMRPVMRGGYNDYFSVGPDQKFSMTRPAGGGNFNEPRR